MSKFFRRLPDSDSSSSASDSEDLEENENDQNSNGLSGSRGLDLATPPVQDGASNAVAVAGPNKDLLLHALLEEKCLNDVRKEHAGRSTSEAAIVIEARNRSVNHRRSTQSKTLTIHKISSTQFSTSSSRSYGSRFRQRQPFGCASTISGWPGCLLQSWRAAWQLDGEHTPSSPPYADFG